ncbi:hypothetical protein RRG51_03105 [Mycoplasmopsis cynos]|uniref:hypothetical protein n=1 Tax=Mycoplasmopsis cynos TaxID=171284 RepID=UPI002AFEF6E4|nr:hypothetical protein [Mycoplasmopsis cynos]WQQ15988.1 hypothetical protein RRG51_03105 [Mycoplasmopsis cynos]
MKKWKTIFISAGLLSSVALFPSLIACNDTAKSPDQGKGKKSADTSSTTEKPNIQSHEGTGKTESDKKGNDNQNTEGSKNSANTAPKTDDKETKKPEQKDEIDKSEGSVDKEKITPPTTEKPNVQSHKGTGKTESDKKESGNQNTEGSKNSANTAPKTKDKETKKPEQEGNTDKKDENQNGSADASKEEKWKNAFELYDSSVTFEKVKSKYEDVKKKSKKFQNENYIQKYGKNDKTFFGIKSGNNKEDNKLFKLHNGLNSDEIEYKVYNGNKKKTYTQEYFDFSIDEANKKVIFKFRVKGIEKEIKQEISFPASSESSTNSTNQSGSSDEDE